ncbi:pantetheine-phosphate adenylyltransferase [Hansschlegelia quercus]|uniref:Phosphopantetheine adenylyltransferase n=1 Tax=Hansschlegelia quercus TaxID=2528245 RepID=A0A4Q9GLD6_9HYPH|nr:pantetheine-phosphate adenylyltransferase [Hansschlegelia quercus]TBN55042.1 pantetheine-phosphate adenylyltransferase [Hansschlegelia quercus]
MPRIAFYPGSFDPVTNGHLDILGRALGLTDRVVVGVGAHVGKAPLFSVEERIEMLRLCGAPLAAKSGATLEVISFQGLVVEAAAAVGSTILIRGVRDGADFDYEMQMAGMNAALDATLQTVFLPAAPAFRPISATLVRQIAAMGGDVGAFVAPEVARRLAARSA